MSPPVVAVVGLTIVPILFLVATSFAEQQGFKVVYGWSLRSYTKILGDPLFTTLLWRSLWISASATVVTVVAAYPIAYYVAFHVVRRKLLWIILLTTPAWTSYLLRVFAWKAILGYNGVVNSGLLALGVIAKPLSILVYNPAAVILTLTHAWMPFALLPIYINLERFDRSLIEAAADLGEGGIGRFLRVTLPLSMPGIRAAALMIFIPTVGDYITPQLVGGPNGFMIANLIASYFGVIRNWPVGAAMSIVAIGATLLCLLVAAGIGWAARRVFVP